MKYLTCIFFSCLLISSSAFAAPSYNIMALGLAGSEHTRDDGFRYSRADTANRVAHAFSRVGHVIGSSSRYNGGCEYLGQSAWFYDGTTTINVGLTGPEHTRADGYKSNQPVDLSEAGLVIGRSERYDGGSTSLGNSAWLYNGLATVDISRTGPEFTRGDGYRESYPVELNEAGQILGLSARYSGDASLGQSSWLFDGATTIDLGLTGPEYVRSDGYKLSAAGRLNDAGQVNGYSARYSGDSDLGYSAWLYDGVTTTEIGLTGAEFTRSDGYRKNIAAFGFESTELNEAGQVVGFADRYHGGSTYLGQSTWLYDGAKTIEIGLTGSEHTRDDGYRNSQFLSGPGFYPMAVVNMAGQTIGNSDRFNGGSTNMGQSAWIYDGTTTIDIGLAGPEFTAGDGYKSSQAEQLNEAGQVAGFSGRYNGGTYMGQSAWLYDGKSAWLYDGTTTIEIGLTGAEHSNADGYKSSHVVALNNAGQVIGVSEDYGEGTNVGKSAWLYNGATTIEIGLTGPEYTRSDGHSESYPVRLNESGQVVGTSYRYDSEPYHSDRRDAWFYDPLLDEIIPLRFPEHGADRFTHVAYLGDDGLVLGNYGRIKGNDMVDQGLFYFTLADDLHDLGSLVNGGLAANGWDYLADAIRTNDLGQILGHGKLHSQSIGQMAYLLTPVVPEPSSIALIVLTSLTLYPSRRK